jgi:hypothetical protein
MADSHAAMPFTLAAMHAFLHSHAHAHQRQTREQSGNRAKRAKKTAERA